MDWILNTQQKLLAKHVKKKETKQEKKENNNYEEINKMSKKINTKNI